MAECRTTVFEGDYDLLEPLPDDFTCPLCLSLIKVPVLTSCCGHLFCEACLQPVKSRNMPCPLCKVEVISFIVDKRVYRQIKQLRVNCKNRRAGCEWNGELSQLEVHLTACIYEVVSCPQECEWADCRQFLNAHIFTECPNRQYSCKFCSASGTYCEITERHFPVCKKYPIQCPNDCDVVDIPRDQMEGHLTTCTLQPVDCTFKAVGCTVRVARADLDAHLDTHVTQHIALMRSWVESRIDQMEGRIQDCVARGPTLQDVQALVDEQRTLARRDGEEQARALKQELERKTGHISEVSRRINRLKQELEQDMAQTVRELVQKNEELSSKVQQLSEQQGKRDRDLRKAKLDAVTALERAEDVRQSEMRTAQVLRAEMQDVRDSLESELCLLRDEKDAQILSLGGEINHIRSTTVQEMRSLSQELQRKDTLIDNLKSLVPVVPFTFTLVNYEAHCYRPISNSLFGSASRGPGFAYFSPPFYSHIGGYKFCLRVRVSLERLAVHCFIMAGENDESLGWPKCLTLSVSLLHTAVSATRTQTDVKHVTHCIFERVTAGRSLGTAVGWDTFQVDNLAWYLERDRLHFTVGIQLQ